VKKKLYIETSVWNQLHQDLRPDLRENTEKFMSVVQAGAYEVFISDYVLFEVDKCLSEEKRAQLLQWIEGSRAQVLTPGHECESLMEAYFAAGILSPTRTNKYYDAGHVAVASVNGIEYLLTYNYKHLLKVNKIDAFNGVNLLHSYGEIRFVPPEFFLPEETNEEA
jgi:predicted nucleic acid-binding protein